MASAVAPVKPTVGLGVTSLAATTCGGAGGRIGPTRCAGLDAARGASGRTPQASPTSLAARRSARRGRVAASRLAAPAAPGGALRKHQPALRGNARG